jgi:hypothetical protein
MTLGTVALYLHILGAMGLVVALGLEWVVVARLRTAETAEQARTWLGLTAVQRRLGPAALAAILIPGLYLAATGWGGAGWIVVGLAALLLIAAFGAFNGIRLAAIGPALAAETGDLSPERAEQLRDPRFVVSMHARVAIVLGVVFLMTAKPDLLGSLLVVGGALVLGVASALPAWVRQRARETYARGGV